LAAGADVNAKNKYGSTPLHRAIEAAHKEIAELLIANGADVNAKGEADATPLHYAATKEVAELLIVKGADVNAKDEFGETPLDLADGKTETADLLRKHGGKTGEELKGK
jgi:ankyrin repeat protein